jgi:acetate CoA/acetoacetate CoA-transferase beta subunit
MKAMDAQSIIAKRIAQELRSGMLVNLGIGIPTMVANYVPSEIKIFFQSENGLIGTGPIPEEGMGHRLLTDAGSCRGRAHLTVQCLSVSSVVATSTLPY